MEQTICAEAWRGKRIRFSGAVRAEVEGPGNGAQLYIETRPKPPEEGMWTMPATAMAMVEPSVCLPQWGRYAAEIAVPDEAHTILIGMALAGNGAAWFGDLKLESA